MLYTFAGFHWDLEDIVLVSEPVVSEDGEKLGISIFRAGIETPIQITTGNDDLCNRRMDDFISALSVYKSDQGIEYDD